MFSPFNTILLSMVMKQYLTILFLMWKQYRYTLVTETDFDIDEEGCKEHMSRLEIEKHESVCLYAFEDCPYSSRCPTMRRGQMKVHASSECPHRPVECQYCGFETAAERLDLHLKECPDLPLSCVHCQSMVLRKRTKRHLERECEGKKHSCPYAAQGCAEEGNMSPKELAVHLNRAAADHLELVQQDMALNAMLIENRLLKQLAIKDAEIEELKRSSRNRYRFVWNVPWKHTPGDTTTVRAYTSEKFDIFGRKFYLALWPIGEPQPDNSRENIDTHRRSISNDTQSSTYLANEGAITNLNSNAESATAAAAASYQSNTSSSSSSSVVSTPIEIGRNGRRRSTSGSASSGPTTSTSTPAPPISASPKSFSQQVFDKLRSFTRQRSQEGTFSSNQNPSSNTSASTSPPMQTYHRHISNNADSSSLEGPSSSSEPTTWVAIYLMMEPAQPAPQSASAAPRIYSPLSGLSRGSHSKEGGSYTSDHLSSTFSTLSTSPNHPQTQLQHQQYLQSLYSHDPSRMMNVNLGSAPSLPMRPPETMVLEYTLRIVNNSPLLNKSVYFETNFPVPDGNGWGEEYFIETAQISRSTGFLNSNNSLLVQCDIQVRQCTFEV